ncbi:hypothetical protein Rhow_002149 [Rhodococcus wratislaviensis]|uniref:Uncharacterized protein n=1 Tax=Rhodococcus wratislaviensis TaxID=44752 RepID=A0A402C4Q8_RHOWR|nr:hypothetical protein Rhow_002149 [Rhodococcus wratislaviensis]
MQTFARTIARTISSRRLSRVPADVNTAACRVPDPDREDCP